MRFVETGPQEVFEIAEIATETRVVDLSPRRGSPDGGWQVTGIAQGTGWKGERLALRMVGGEDAVLTREMPAAGVDIHVIEIEIGGLRPSASVRLLWAEEGQPFANHRSIRFGARQGEGTMFRTFRFDVGKDSDWSDRVAKIQIRITGDQPHVFLGQVTVFHLDLDRERFQDALAESWLYELGGHHRAVRLAFPGAPVDGRVRLREGAELRFGVGVPDSQPVGARFRVSVTVTNTGQSTTVFDYHPSGDQQDDWTNHVVDLSAFAGLDVRFSLDVEADADLDPLLGLPIWANPVVWAPTSETQPPNIVLISIDTLRADHLSLYGYPRRTSPKIDRWAERRAVVFETVVAPSPWTLPSHVSMLTGTNAVHHGINHPAPAPSTLLTLAEILRFNGYSTGAVTGGSYLHPRFGLAQGFDSYRSYDGKPALEFETEVNWAMQWLEDHAGTAPFFFFFHTYEVHVPYDPREPFFSEFAGHPFEPAYKDAVTRNSKTVRPDRLRNTNLFGLRRAEDNKFEPLAWNDVKTITDLYDSGVAYTDDGLGLLLERVSELDLSDNTLVILTSDHGEALGEHSLAGHSSLYDHDLLVPLVIALPGGVHGGERVKPQVRSVDIVSTVLDVVGLPPPPGIDGKSLTPLISGEDHGPRLAESYTALSNHGLSLRSGEGEKYIFRNLPWAIPSGWEELYDLDHDPGELKNLAASSASTDTFRLAAVGRLVDRQSGLRLEMVNRSDRGCRFELRGHGIAIGSHTLKTTRLGGGCTILEAGTVACDLGPESEMVLIGERIQDPSVEISGVLVFEGAAHPQSFSLGYEIGRDNEPRSAVFKPEDGSEGEGEVSISINWVGDPGILGFDPADSDDELRRQLEALGYIQ